MTLVALLRHGPTEWNRTGRLQGQRDVPLDDEARDWLRRHVLPAELRPWRWHVSPLARARETATLIGIEHLQIEPRLLEMDWGDWEGRTVTDLRQELGSGMAELEARGLDFRPPGGESPRQLQARVGQWLRELADGQQSVGAVAHKGVIRTVLALAFDWDMLGKPPARLDWTCLHLFRLDRHGRPSVERLNLPLAARGSP